MSDGATTPRYGEGTSMPDIVRCAQCGYDLAEIDREVCPECGADITNAGGGTLDLRLASEHYRRLIRHGLVVLLWSYAAFPILIAVYFLVPSMAHFADHASWVPTILGWWWVGTEDPRDSAERRWSDRRMLRTFTLILGAYAVLAAGTDFYARATGAGWHGLADNTFGVIGIIAIWAQAVFGLRHLAIVAGRIPAPKLQRSSAGLARITLALVVMTTVAATFITVMMLAAQSGPAAFGLFCGTAVLLPVTALFGLYVLIATIILLERIRRRMKVLERWIARQAEAAATVSGKTAPD